MTFHLKTDKKTSQFYIIYMGVQIADKDLARSRQERCDRGRTDTRRKCVESGGLGFQSCPLLKMSWPQNSLSSRRVDTKRKHFCVI
jgi:hypothetical protein